MTNYSRKLRIGVNIRSKEKVEKAMEFAERSSSGIKESTEGDEETGR